MRKIKRKPLKPAVLKPPSDAPVILVSDAFAYHRLMQEYRDQYEWERGLERLRNRLNGLPVEPEPNYIAEAFKCEQ